MRRSTATRTAARARRCLTSTTRRPTATRSSCCRGASGRRTPSICRPTAARAGRWRCPPRCWPRWPPPPPRSSPSAFRASRRRPNIRLFPTLSAHLPCRPAGSTCCLPRTRSSSPTRGCTSPSGCTPQRSQTGRWCSRAWACRASCWRGSSASAPTLTRRRSPSIYRAAWWTSTTGSQSWPSGRSGRQTARRTPGRRCH
ncbi:hypothetical protein DFJ74DRAFT_655620 [Hyaloraphidium curvatum]|nr:hypothetical protein DFJ74DRAFT_655620 [Hyaloraphidium curvatum]